MRRFHTDIGCVMQGQVYPAGQMVEAEGAEADALASFCFQQGPGFVHPFREVDAGETKEGENGESDQTAETAAEGGNVNPDEETPAADEAGSAAPDAPQDQVASEFPKKLDKGRWRLSSGKIVKGEPEAREAQAALDAK